MLAVPTICRGVLIGSLPIPSIMHTKPVPSQIRMFGVYGEHRLRNSAPSFQVDKDTAYYWLECGFARRVTKWTIALTKTPPLKLRDRSSNIKEATIHAAIDGNRYCQALIQTWS